MNKLQNFISQLSDPNLPAEQQSFLLSPSDSDLLGGDNLGTCANKSSSACNDTNTDCTNYDVCEKSTNYGVCKNIGTLGPKPDPVNPGTDNGTKDCG